jgi:hypothetical protein
MTRYAAFALRTALYSFNLRAQFRKDRRGEPTGLASIARANDTGIRGQTDGQLVGRKNLDPGLAGTGAVSCTERH